jgi:hypothetical protein
VTCPTFFSPISVSFTDAAKTVQCWNWLLGLRDHYKRQNYQLGKANVIVVKWRWYSIASRLNPDLC